MTTAFLAAVLAARVLIVGAPADHDSTEAYRRALASTGLYEVSVVEEPSVVTTAVAARYSAVVANGVVLAARGGRSVVNVRPGAGVASLLSEVARVSGVRGQTEVKAAPLRVLVVTGGHDYDPSFESLFEGWTDLSVVVDPHPKAYNRDLVKRFDVIVLYDMIPDITEQQKKNLTAYLESGKGLVVMHHALCSFDGQDWWRQVTGGHYPQKGGSYQHDRDLTAKRVKDHPVVAGIPASWAVHDETYKGLKFADGNNVLVSTDDTTADGPLVWISAWAKARVVSIQPGHNRESHYDPIFRRLVHNAINWSAGR